jgi:hypothetical protein
MNRLPCCDRMTSRSESAVFASLGFAGLLMLALAAAQATWFVSGGERISAGLEAALPTGESGAVATKVIGPLDPRAARIDPSLPTNSASPATPG